MSMSHDCCSQRRGQVGATREEGQKGGPPRGVTGFVAALGPRGHLRESAKDHQWHGNARLRRSTRSDLRGAVAQPSDVAGNESDAGNKEFRFGSLPTTEAIDKALREMKVLEPFPIQDEAMRRICDGDDILLHAETGSGKTLAYLLPLIVRLLSSDSGRSYLVVVPSQELATQVHWTAHRLLGSGSERLKLLLQPTELKPAPVLYVTTAKVLQALSDQHTEPGFFSAFDAIVLDEVDRLLGSVGKHASRHVKQRRVRHPKPVARLLERLSADGGRRPQIIGASATVGRQLRRELASKLSIPVKEGIPVVRGLPDTSDVAGTDTEGGVAVLIPSTIRHICVPLVTDGVEERTNALTAALVELEPQRPLVFVNKTMRASDLVEELVERGWTEAVALNEAFGQSAGGKNHEGLQRYSWLMDAYEGRTTEQHTVVPLLVAGEMSARGLHLSNVDYVFLIDCPEDQNEYQHLAGRTGRAGQRGTAVSICSYRKARVMNSWESQLNIRFEQLKLEGFS